MTIELSPDQARLFRAKGQYLHEPGERVPLLDVIGSVFGINAQRSSAMMLSLRARIRGLEAGDVLEAIDTKRDLVRTWAMRGTIHLMRAEDVAWVVPVLGPRFIQTGRRRRDELGLSEDKLAKGLKEIRAILGRAGPLTRRELTDRLAVQGLVLDGNNQAPYHLIHYAALKELICIGPERPNGESTYVLFEKWVGRSRPGPGKSGVARLAGRYLDGYGPAGIDDFACWSGLAMAGAKAAFKTLAEAGRLTEARVEGRSLWMPGAWAGIPEEAGAGKHVVKLLPAFDSCLLGYRDRELFINREHQGEIYHGGQVVPAVTVDGVVAGTWRYERRGRKLELSVWPFKPFSGEIRASISEEAEDVGRFLGYPASLSIPPRGARQAKVP